MEKKNIAESTSSLIDDFGYYFGHPEGIRTILFLSSTLTLMLFLSLISKMINIILLVMFGLTAIGFYFKLRGVRKRG